MPEVPKIVHERLRTMLPAGTLASVHPDSNLLSAFAEQTLTTTEREQVLAHLAGCEDCRTAVVLALPALEGVTVPEKVTESEGAALPAGSKGSWLSRPMFAWPSLRWGALAAGVIVAGGLLLRYSGNSNAPAIARQANSKNKSADIATVPAPQMPWKSENRGEKAFVAGEADAFGAQKAESTTKLDALVSQNKPVVSRKDAQGSSESSLKKQLVASVPAAGNNIAAANGKRRLTAGAARETVEVAGALNTGETRDSKLSDQATNSDAENLRVNGVNARNEMMPSPGKEAAPAITRAKPATAAEQSEALQVTAAAGAVGSEAAKVPSSAAPSWSLSSGILRRSQDGGATWQTSLSDERLLSYASRGNEIWAGGKSGFLFYSRDNGSTWVQVHPKSDGRSLASDVTHLEFRNASLALTTDSGETWTTADAGKTWTAK